MKKHISFVLLSCVICNATNGMLQSYLDVTTNETEIITYNHEPDSYYQSSHPQKKSHVRIYPNTKKKTQI